MAVHLTTKTTTSYCVMYFWLLAAAPAVALGQLAKDVPGSWPCCATRRSLNPLDAPNSHAQQVTERKIIPSPLQGDANLPAATLLLCYELTHAHCLRLPRGAFMVSHKPWNGMRSVHYYINTGRHSHFVSDCSHD